MWMYMPMLYYRRKSYNCYQVLLLQRHPPIQYQERYSRRQARSARDFLADFHPAALHSYYKRDACRRVIYGAIFFGMRLCSRLAHDARVCPRSFTELLAPLLQDVASGEVQFLQRSEVRTLSFAAPSISMYVCAAV